MTQSDAVYEAMQAMGGYATLGQLNQAALKVPGVEWKTKTPFASIRRIVQKDDRFFRIRPGLWALEAKRNVILNQFAISDNAAPPLVEEFNHGYYQGLLVEIGNLRGFSTFVPHQDKNRKFLNKSLSEVTTLSQFHEFSYDHVLRKARTIDVTWFNERDFPSAFFEVEHSTDIQNSLVKFVELQDFYTQFNIVADAVRHKEFNDKLAASAFRPIRERVAFIDYEAVANLHTESFRYSEAAKAFPLPR